MVTGENFKRICWNRQNNKPELPPEIKSEIKKLQKIDTALWENDDLSDEYVKEESKKINARINELIDKN